MSNPRIKRSRIKCNHCGKILESFHRHDYKTHHCTKAGKISRSYDHEKGGYIEDYPFMMIDGGCEYVRAGGDPKDYTLLTEYYKEGEVEVPIVESGRWPY